MAILNVHAAELKDNLGTRLIVAYKQIPGSVMNALVIKIDSMTRDVDREELRHMVSSREAQVERDFINILHKKNLLKFYQDNNYFTKVAVDDVVMTPGNGQKIPLRDVINMINQKNGVGPMPTQAELDSLSTKDPLAQQKHNELMQTESKTNIAKNILVEAKLLQDEVKRKINQALSVDPSVKPIADRILQGLPLDQPITVEMPKAKQETATPAKKSRTKKSAAK